MKKFLISFLLCLCTCHLITGQIIPVVKNNRSSYRIVIPDQARASELKAATVLQKYMVSATGANLEIIKGFAAGKQPFIAIGDTKESQQLKKANIRNDGYIIAVNGQNIIITGQGEKGSLYGVYSFIEHFLGCRKWTAGVAFVPKVNMLNIPADTRIVENPVFEFRQVYFPASTEQEFIDWHKLHRFSDSWGLWAHSFDNLVPPAKYFKEHPEYYALVNGKRSSTQLCLSNDTVLNIAISSLKALMKEKENALYWSISANDQAGFCTCDRCADVTRREGGVSGNVVTFVNKIAGKFPDKTFSTLAYSLTRKPPAYVKPAANVMIMLSNISSFRTQPLSQEASAASFRDDLNGWKKKTSRIFIWDYVTQFTNYLTPFPVTQNFSPNARFFQKEQISGIFEQGSGYVYSDMAELKTYLLAKLLWNPSVNADKIIDEFMNGYYGKAGIYIKQYINSMYNASVKQDSKLRLFGNPVESRSSYLSPTMMQQYSQLLNKAQNAVAKDPELSKRVANLKVSYDFAYLQLARFYGSKANGFFTKLPDGMYTTADNVKKMLTSFEQVSKNAGISQLAEGGGSPREYIEEIQRTATRINKCLSFNANIQLLTKNMPAYPANGPATLVDGMEGTIDIGNGYLCFHQTPMIALIDLGRKASFKDIIITFLDSPPKVVFRPESVKVEVSADGVTFSTIDVVKGEPLTDNQKASRVSYKFSNKKNASIRFLKVTAQPFNKLYPPGRFSENTKPIIACDEIWVE